MLGAGLETHSTSEVTSEVEMRRGNGDEERKKEKEKKGWMMGVNGFRMLLVVIGLTHLYGQAETGARSKAQPGGSSQPWNDPLLLPSPSDTTIIIFNILVHHTRSSWPKGKGPLPEQPPSGIIYLQLQRT